MEGGFQGEAEQRYTGADWDERHQDFVLRFSRSGSLRLELREDLRKRLAPVVSVPEGPIFPFKRFSLDSNVQS